MAENTTSLTKSLSDSELNRHHSEESSTTSKRTRTNSEKYIPSVQRFQLSTNNNEKDSHKNSCETTNMILQNVSYPTEQAIKNNDDPAETLMYNSCKIQQQNVGIEERMESYKENKNVLPQHSSNGNSVTNCYLKTILTSNDVDTQANIDEISNLQKSSEKVYEKQMSSEEQISKKGEIEGLQERGNRKESIENFSPYHVIEQINANASSISDNILGEPRCLALKKYILDGDDFDLDFEMSTDMEDENAVPPCQEKSETIQNKDNQQQDINDMFLDDDPNDVTEIRNIPYINIASPRKDFEKWDYPSFEREEGELTPDLHLEHSGKDGHKRATSKKAKIKESNAEFFTKVNRCFRHVEKEFSSMHVPSGSKRLIEDLRNTLCVVERMKRKLTFLINSANSSSGNDKNSSSSKNKEHAKSSSPNAKVTSEKEFKNHDDDQKLKDFISYQSNKYQGKLKDNYLHNKSQSSLTLSSANIHSKREMVKAKMDHLRRTFATVTHSDSKMERQRIQSLFKRQMNLITQQIIQQSDQSKHQNSKSGNSSKTSSSKSTSHKHQQRRPSLENFKTLEEMENFLDLLKEKKGQKITPEDIIQHHRKKQVLKFTTKKGDPVPQARALSVLLSGDAEDGNKIPTQVINSENSLLQTYTQDGKEQNGKHIQVQEKRKPEKEVIRNQKDLQSDYTVDKASESYNLNAKVSSKSNISKQQSAGEVKNSKNIAKKGEIDTNLKKQCVGEIEFRRDRNGSALKEVIDSSMVKRNSREIKCSESPFHSRSSDFEKDSSREIFPENSIKRISKKHSVPKSSESDSDSRKHRILKKRKRNESDGDSRRKLSCADLKKETVSEKKSRTRYRSDDEEEEAVIDGVDEKLPEELLSKKLFIVGDENLALLDKHFCVKVKGNQIYLKKVGKVRKERYRSGREQRKNSPEFPKLLEEEELTPEKSSYERKDREIPIATEEDNGPSLKEMEDFLQQLRAKKISVQEQQDSSPKSNQQSREMKFMARIQAKRKAKLMACVSTTPNISEKEAKFLKDLENRVKNPCDSPDTESKKQKLMEKIRAETDFIILSQKHTVALEDDPLKDVKTFLNMIKEAESTKDESSKQFYVSFPLKRSDVKKLENITAGKASALSEESQRLLNSVRSKMRAKKAQLILDDSNRET